MKQSSLVIDKVNRKFKSQSEEGIYAHADFIKAIDGFCSGILANETHKLNYLYFVADVVAYSNIEGLQPQYYFSIAKEIINYHKRYLEYEKKLQDMLLKRNIKLVEKVNTYRKTKVDLKQEILAP